MYIYTCDLVNLDWPYTPYYLVSPNVRLSLLWLYPVLIYSHLQFVLLIFTTESNSVSGFCVRSWNVVTSMVALSRFHCKGLWHNCLLRCCISKIWGRITSRTRMMLLFQTWRVIVNLFPRLSGFQSNWKDLKIRSIKRAWKELYQIAINTIMPICFIPRRRNNYIILLYSVVFNVKMPAC